MKQVLPKINFESKDDFNIEVMDLNELYLKLNQIKNHNPFAPHKIRFYLIITLTVGEYKHFVDFNFYNLHENSVLFVANNQVHHFTKSLKQCQGYAIALNSKFIENNYIQTKNTSLNRLYNYHLECPVLYSNMLSEDFFITIRNLYKEYNSTNEVLKIDLLRSYLNIILIQAERSKQQKANIVMNIESFSVFNIFNRLLLNKYASTRSAKEYSDHLMMTYKSLNKIVKEVSGKTVKQFIDDFVILEIKRYLSSTKLSIKEVSYKTGFDDPSNLVRYFKKHTSITPLHFRQSI